MQKKAFYINFSSFILKMARFKPQYALDAQFFHNILSRSIIFSLFRIILELSCKKISRKLLRILKERLNAGRVNYAGGRRRDRRQKAAVRYLGQRRECGLQNGFDGRVGRDSSHPGGARYSDCQRISVHLPRDNPGQRER